MNVYQAIAFRAQHGRNPDGTGNPIESLQQVKTYAPNTKKAKKKAAFLQAFEKNGSITKSAQLAGIDRTTHYEWVANDPTYKAEFGLKLLMSTEALKDELLGPAVKGVFKPHIYKGKYCYESRIRTICQLADGTSAFEDELAKGAKVIGRRDVEVHDGKMIGKTRISSSALAMLLALTLPEEFGDAVKRVRKKRAD